MLLSCFSEEKIVRNEFAVFANCLFDFCDFKCPMVILLRVTVHLTNVRVFDCTRSYRTIVLKFAGTFQICVGSKDLLVAEFMGSLYSEL